eukprot:6087804-Amphidinium_carterae.1
MRPKWHREDLGPRKSKVGQDNMLTSPWCTNEHQENSLADWDIEDLVNVLNDLCSMGLDPLAFKPSD